MILNQNKECRQRDNYIMILAECQICYLKWARSALCDLWLEVCGRVADKAQGEATLYNINGNKVYAKCLYQHTFLEVVAR